MKRIIMSGVFSLLLVTSSFAQTDHSIIQSFESTGQMVFERTSNAVSYRVEWAPTVDGPWTNTWAGLENIPGEGSGPVTAAVPMAYRVVATMPTPVPANMSLIPAGEFVMGDTFGNDKLFVEELPLHTNYISAFYMDKYEVTLALWDEVHSWAITNGYSFGAPYTGKATNHPVVLVYWYDTLAWCNARSEREGLMPCYTNANGTIYKNAAGNSFDGGCNWTANGYRLPTEAEWEKSARGGVAGQRFPWGNTITHTNANYYAWPLPKPGGFIYDLNPTNGYHQSFNTDPQPYTSPVGHFAPNGYGLYDMAGNAMEWCWDWSGSYGSEGSTDPRGPTNGTIRVLRGASWNYDANAARVAGRVDFGAPNYGSNDIGFRCARGL